MYCLAIGVVHDVHRSPHARSGSMSHSEAPPLLNGCGEERMTLGHHVHHTQAFGKDHATSPLLGGFVAPDASFRVLEWLNRLHQRR
jgi:hypothetical protein